MLPKRDSSPTVREGVLFTAATLITLANPIGN
jgi:hypothetical protein